MKEAKFRILSFSELLRHFFLSWLIAALIEYLLVPSDAKNLAGLRLIAAMSFPRFLIVIAVCTASLYLVSNFFDIARYERYAFPGVFLLLTVVSLPGNFRPAFLILCLIILGVFTVYGIWGHKAEDTAAKPIQKSHWAFPAVLAVLTLGMAVILCLWSVCRYLCFHTPTFDFGIFAQMFHNMRTTGLPMTTVERDGLLSHFAVHVSPIYYLMLPFYCLFPNPATLQVLQVLVVCSAVIPLWLIGKHHGLSGLGRLLTCTLLLVLPAVGGGIFYDLHENCFLLPLLLWLMYAIDKRNTLLICIFSFLTLTVKEDAAVYVAIAALYWILRTAINRGNRKDLLTGIGVLLFSVLYFLAVTNYLATQGDGVMTYRYSNFMPNGSGSLFSVIISVLMCPMKMLYECVDSEKFSYIFQTMLPLLALPLITRKFDRYVLLIPYILVNLMPDYEYQHNIFFQYNFGSTAFLLYLTAVNLADLRIAWKRIVPLSMAILTAAVFFRYTVAPQVLKTVRLYWNNSGYYSGIRQELDRIPENASVSAGTFYVAYLSERSVLYDIEYNPLENVLTAEYIVLNRNFQTDSVDYGSFEDFSALLEENGYQIINDHKTVAIFHKAAQ